MVNAWGEDHVARAVWLTAFPPVIRHFEVVMRHILFADGA